MAEYEYEYNSIDYQLVATQNDTAQLTENDYARITVYRRNSNNIATLSGGNQAIFYSSLSTTPFDINISPFGGDMNEIVVKTVGIGFDDENNPYNDFEIFKNPTDGSIYIKPNEILNDFGLPEGNYRIQVDFLSQV